VIDLAESAQRDIEMSLTTEWKKFPEDIARYRIIIERLTPQVIIETGTGTGMQAMWFSNHARQVITIDNTDRRKLIPFLAQPNIKYIKRSSTSRECVREVKRILRYCTGPVLVSLDSAHDTAHVQREIAAYAPLVTPGSYLVVEDTIHHWRADFIGNDPYVAVKQSTALSHFHIDNEIQNLSSISANPYGWLRRNR
jgi:cephalosporin hydroxylase